MTLGQAFAWMLVGFVWAAIALSVTDGRIRAWARRRRELARLGRIPTEPSRINQIRRDPSPQPRRRAS